MKTLFKLVVGILLGLAISLRGLDVTAVGSFAQAHESFASVETAASAYVDSASEENVEALTRRGRQLYQNGEYEAAIATWQSVADLQSARWNSLAQASALSNLSLAYQQLSEWSLASETLSESFRLLENQPESQSYWQVFSQVLTTRGRLQLATGRVHSALESWQQAEALYRQVGDEVGIARSQINQVQALRELGYYRQSLERLTDVSERLTTQPPSLIKGVTLRRLGDILRLTGDLNQAKTVLEQSLAIARQENNLAEISATLLSLGHVAIGTDNLAVAGDYYQQAISLWGHSTDQPFSPEVLRHVLPAELSQLALWIDSGNWEQANTLWPRLQAQLGNLPASRGGIYHQVHWAQSVIRLKQSDLSALEVARAPDWLTLARQLQQTAEQARTLGDQRAEAHVVGTLGEVYEQTQQWAIAQSLTQQALHLSQKMNATEMIYHWQSQLGRLWQASGNPDRSVEKALTAYGEAVESLSNLRGDLAIASESAQFSFQETVEPIYREFVSLLLQAAEPQAAEPSSAIGPQNQVARQQYLTQAQGVIESLRLAELDNYFKEACLDTKEVNISQVDPKAGILYTITLKDQLAIILQLPNQPLQKFSTPVNAAEVEQMTAQLRKELVTRSHRRYLPLAQQVYDWLIRPARAAINSAEIDTLVFVLDGPLQNIPMGALHDGQHYLVEDYGVALTPGITLLNPQPWENRDLSVLAAGLTESRQGRAPLPYVAEEIARIGDIIQSNTILLDQQFTYNRLFDRVKTTRYPIIHIATHGQFSSTPEKTYLVAWDQQINVREVNHILRANLGDRKAIELLVLSACETASGDKRAALGLAGVAIRAGARSTLGGLWAINDEATAQFTSAFYQQLTKPGSTRAQALRQAQLQLMKEPQYRHPVYWAPYVLLGSWL
ncbi:MAG: CHAT domain-containing protein [Cyanobacteria bacterium J06626_6]